MYVGGFEASVLYSREVSNRLAAAERHRLAAAAARSRHPNALSCLNFYDLYPERVGAMGSVVVTNFKDVEPWLLVARAVTKDEAEKRGGCIIYAPSLTKARKGVTIATDAQYYCITDSDDVVYGRAAYIPSYSSAQTACDIDFREGEPLGTPMKLLDEERGLGATFSNDSALTLTSDSECGVYYGKRIR